MAGTSLPITRLLHLDVPVTWQEAVAVVHAVDALSAATGVPITLDHCHITADGDVHLTPPGPGDTSQPISSLQLLAVLLREQTSTRELRVLAVAVDTSGASGAEPGRLRVDLRWCLGANPQADVAGLAARAIATDQKKADDGGASGHPGTGETGSPANLTSSPAPQRGPARRQTVLTVRIQHLSPGLALTMAGVLVAVLGGAAAAGLVIAKIDVPPPATRAAVGNLPERPSAMHHEPKALPVEFLVNGGGSESPIYSIP